MGVEWLDPSIDNDQRKAMSSSSARTRHLKAIVIVLVSLLIIGLFWWMAPRPESLPEHIASGNGRIEATEVDIATGAAGRLEQFFVQEGDLIDAGSPIAEMDTDELDARNAAAQANLNQAMESKRLANAVVAQRESELRLRRAELARYQSLLDKGHISQEQIDQSRTAAETAQAALQAALVQVSSAEAGIAAARANLRQIESAIEDTHLNSPVGGRVLYRLAEPGEVLAPGGKVATVLDVTDVYMTIFLPTSAAGRVRMGSEARIVLDAVPDYVVPAEVSFVAAEAQFTPKSVETRSEREKLMFRVRVRIDPELLSDYRNQVKTGLPGEAYVRLDERIDWPDFLQLTRNDD
jgi:HlyD family secretion protein